MARKLQPVLFIPDAHRPYHDERAWSLMLKVGKALKPKHLVVLGDLADFYSISHYSKDPTRANRLPEELADVRHGLDQLDALGATDKRFLAGNHCWRWERYLQDKAPELFGVTDIPTLLDLPGRGWTYVPYKHDTRLGKCYATHDVGKAGRYAVYQCLDTYQHTIVTGHTHRLAYIVEGNAVGEFKLSAQFGWLGDADKVDYMHRVRVRKEWALGFGVGYLAPATGIVYATPIPIIKRGNYTCVFNGTLYSA